MKNKDLKKKLYEKEYTKRAINTQSVEYIYTLDTVTVCDATILFVAVSRMYNVNARQEPAGTSLAVNEYEPVFNNIFAAAAILAPEPIVGHEPTVVDVRNSVKYAAPLINSGLLNEAVKS